MNLAGIQTQTVEGFVELFTLKLKDVTVVINLEDKEVRAYTGEGQEYAGMIQLPKPWTPQQAE